MASRVVPAMGVTMVRSFCKSPFVREDFPTLGMPTIAKRSPSSPSVSDGGSVRSNFFKIASNRSPVWRPFNAEIAIGNSNPSS